MNKKMKIVKVKTSQGCLGKNKGTELAPDYILKDTNLKFKECKIIKDNLEETNNLIEKQKGNFFIGGDHSITYPLFKAFAEKHKNSGLIIFDAHPDCVNNFKPPTHEDFVKVLIEEKILSPKNLMIIGLRKIDKLEKIFLDKNKINCFLMKDIKKIKNKKVKNNEVVLNKIKRFSKNISSLYLSIDIDVLDPKYAMGTGYPEKEGFELKDLLFILKGIKKLKALKRIDLVEVNPLKDKNKITLKSAKEIINVFVGADDFID